MFTKYLEAVLSINVKTQKQPRYPSIGEWIKLRYIQTKKYHSAHTHKKSYETVKTQESLWFHHNDMCHHMLPKRIACTARKVNYKVNYGLGVIMMCHCKFISHNKCTTLVEDLDNWEGMHMSRQGIYVKYLHLPFHLFVNLNLLLEKA